jgi:putative cell wall-binding protein
VVPLSVCADAWFSGLGIVTFGHPSIRRLITLSIRTKRNTRSFAAVVAAALIASVLALVAAPVSATTPINGTTSTSADGRVAGSDRYATATAAASSYLVRRANLTTWNEIVVVSGDNFPDALSAASLAGSYAAPIILMPSDGSLPTVVKEWGLTKRDQIQTNSTASVPFKVVIVGGTSAVPDAGVDALLAVLNAGDLTPASKTRISGSSRTATAKAVMTQTNASGGYTILKASSELFVANENSFADAMSIAPYLFNLGAPLVLTGKDSLGADALSVIKTYKALGGTKLKLLGGTAALSEQIVKDITTNTTMPLTSIARIFGADRYATNVAIQNYVDATSVNANNFGAASVVLVNGTNFADGLAAAPYAGYGTGSAGRLMYLTDGATLSSAIAAKFSALAKVETSLNSLYVVGGTSAVSATVVAGATTAAQALNTTSTMTCVENSKSTSVSITIDGNASDTDVTGSGWLGNETANIKNGSLTINGTSNTNAAATVMASSYSTTTKKTTLTGLVPALSLTKGYVITWSGLSEAANKLVGKRTIAGSSCTVADDKTGPVPTVTAQVGASEFIVTFNEKVSEFDCSDMTLTLAGKVATAPLGCTITGPDSSGLVYKVVPFSDMNGNGSQDGIISITNPFTVTSVVDIVRATHGFVAGDKVTLDATNATDDVTVYVNDNNWGAGTFQVSTTHAVNGDQASASRAMINQPGAAGTIVRVAEPGIVIAAGDIIKVKPQLSVAVEVNAVGVVAAGALGHTCTLTTVGNTTIAAGDSIALRGVATAADNKAYTVSSISGATTVTVRNSAACTSAGDVAGQRVNEGVVYDLSENAGAATITKTLNAITDADVTKPVLTVKLTCTQGSDVVIGNGGTLKATADGTYGPQGVNGNVYKMHVTNVRGSLMPSVTVDDTAKTIRILGDLAYIAANDLQSVYAQAGGVAWTFATVTGTAGDKLGTATATTAAAPLSYASGTAGAQSCKIKVSSNEILQTMAADATTAVAAVNGVAVAISDGGSDAMTVASGYKSFTLTGAITAWKLPLADNTVTITLNGSLIKDQKGNTVTLLSLVD